MGHREERTVEPGEPQDDKPVKSSEAAAAADSQRPKRRGALRWALLLTLVGAAGGAAAGWLSHEPLYRSTGLIYLAAPKPMPGGGGLPRFEAFIQAQVQLLQARRLTNFALATDFWKNAQADRTDGTPESFEERRKVIRHPRTQHIQLQFSDRSPDVALAGVRALIKAYRTLLPDLNRRVEKPQEEEEKAQDPWERLKATKKRLEQALLGEGPLTILDSGQRPTEPFEDRRLVSGAIWGAIGALPGILILLFLRLGAARARKREAAS